MQTVISVNVSGSVAAVTKGDMNCWRLEKMSKWQCCVCGNDEPCILHMVNDKEGFRPVCCPVDNTSGIKPDWFPVCETNQFGFADQLATAIERGGWVYNRQYGYRKILGYENGNIVFSGELKLPIEGIADFVTARLRPWRGSEALNKVVISGGDTFGVVIGCTWSTANVSGQWINCKKLLNDDYKQPDSSPCGVLEHLENGEWVK
jgi:hypothetical protein